MTRAKTSLPAAALAAVVLLFVAATGTRAATFTNEADFINNIAAPYLVETFGSIQTGTTNPPLNFSNSGYSFEALSSSNSAYPDLFGILNGTNRWLTVVAYEDSLVFTNFSLNVSAIGGYFFSTDENSAFTNSSLLLSVQLSDSTLITTNVTSATATNFYGYTFATNIRSLTIGATNANFPTAAKVIAGTTVPEPSSFALLLLGAGAAALLVFKTRRA